MTANVQKEWIRLYEKNRAKSEVGTIVVGTGEHSERPKDSGLLLCLGISTQTHPLLHTSSYVGFPTCSVAT